MRIILIRHGDPDYVHDSLTEEGVKEAKALAATAEILKPGTCFVSPLGRAQKTASYTLKKLGITAEVKDWLQEFPAHVRIAENPEELLRAYPDTEFIDGVPKPHIVWDMVPSYRMAHPELMDLHGWKKSPLMKYSDAVELYDQVTAAFNGLLREHGCYFNGTNWIVEKETEETLTFFCHFGLACVLMSWLFQVSPFLLWHSIVLQPSSVSEIRTEEREKGIAHFRAARIGDISHLVMAGLEPSFAGRFCETYSNFDQRH
ncbi:MAG: histidine phosphatase family protein [Eubacterium sp.]|nr:histidine phosphatase family protein [Eubacterium sp.]